MATVTYNAQSFAVDSRRLWVVGASIHYSRVSDREWANRIEDARQAGFNTIETACPWALHEPRKGRFSFQGQADVARFVRTCGERGMMVALRLGPYVGSGYSGGGLPDWLAEVPDLVPREANAAFLDRASKYLRKLIGELAELQMSSDGPIILVQSEHGWNCSHQHHEERYLQEINRIIHENGINVPILSANDLWADTANAIDTWRGRDEMLPNVRQLRTVQPHAPRLVSGYDAAPLGIWGGRIWGDAGEDPNPDDVLRGFAEILAAGGQPIVTPFHGGTNLGFQGGQLPASATGGEAAMISTTVAPQAPLGEAGARTKTYKALKRIATFASSFGNVFADLDPDYQPICLEPASSNMSIVPLRGAQGRVAFVFANGRQRDATLLLDSGVRMPIDLGDQRVGWYVLDVDIRGHGRLDYANLCPLAVVDRSIVVLFGHERAEVFLSVGGSPVQAKVASGKKPTVLEHQGLTFVICNQNNIDATYVNDEAVYVGISGFDLQGEPLRADGYAKATVVRAESSKQVAVGGGVSPASGKSDDTIKLDKWLAASTSQQVGGTSPRFATLDGPETLAACGVGSGYGWYRIQIKSSAARKRSCHLPFASDRVHLFADGVLQRVIGVGPAAEAGVFDLKLSKGTNQLVALVDNCGRMAEGNDLLEEKGLFGHFYEVKTLKTTRKKVEATPVDPLAMRGFLLGRTQGELSHSEQISWSFTHSKKSPILLDVDGAAVSGTFILNDTPIAYYSAFNGSPRLRLLLQQGLEPHPLKRGKNEIRFAADHHQPGGPGDIVKHVSIYECVEAVSGSAKWAFAKWEPPAQSEYQKVSRTEAKELKGTPCWWFCSFTPDADERPLWFQTTGLSKGVVFVNGSNVGRYFTAGADGKAVGPHKRLYIPASWVDAEGPNELVVFDEHGCDPSRTSVLRAEAGESEQI